MNKSRLLCAVCACAILFATTLSNAASIVGVTISNDGVIVDSGSWNLGYSFTVNNQTSVVSLGIWDYLGDGLINSHEVGLWSSGGSLLASTLVSAGTAGILDSGFRFTDIAPVALTVGDTYYVAATFNGPGDDYWAADPSTLITASEITYDSRRFKSGSTLTFPAGAGSHATGYWGGNVRLSTVPIPPAIWLFGSGLLGLIGVARKKAA